MNQIANLQVLHNLQQQRFPRRIYVIRDRQNPFEYYREEEFRNRFRFTKENVIFITDLIAEQITHDRRGASIPAHIQVLITLRFMATGAFQMTIGDHIHVHQSTVSRVIKFVSIALANLKNVYIKIPNSPQKIRDNNQRFYDMHQFPNVCGLIDCTHIRVANPGGDNAAMFLCRKGYHSINTQVICDSKARIINIVARWYGSAHDSRIFEESRVKQKFENGEIDGLLLGDPGYPCLWYLMTPLRNPTNAQERNYNKSQRKTRSLIERVFGRWKRRFPCLEYKMRNQLNTVFAIIVATAVLYNISIMRNDPNFGDDDESDDDNDDDEDNVCLVVNEAGNVVRARLIAQHF